MEVTVAIRADEGSLYATLSGEFALEEAERTFLQILASLEQHKVPKVVVDGRPLTGEPSPAEGYLYGEFVAVNRGMFVKTFDNLNGALEWLGIEAVGAIADSI